MEETRNIIPEPPGFKEITYTNSKQISYFNDIAALGPAYVSFLESLNHNQLSQQKQTSHFDNIADELYKKLVKKGYIQKPSEICRKGKKGDSDVNFYNSNDGFINDEECCVEKKDFSTCFQDYKSLAVNSLEQLYTHPLYLKKAADKIIEQGKRKAPEPFLLTHEEDFTKFDEIKKNIKMNILNKCKNIPPQSEGNNNKIPNEQQKIEQTPGEVKKGEKKYEVIVINEEPDEVAEEQNKARQIGK